MKSFYKVIKADHLNICPPRVIDHPCRQIQSKIEVEKDKDIIVETELKAQQLLNDARSKAEEIISQAKAEADKLIKDTHQNINKLKREAEKAGYEAGYQAGQASWEKAREQLRQEIANQKEILIQEKNKMLKQLEPEIIQLAVTIARSVIHAELYLAPEQIKSIARAVLDRAQGEGKRILKVSSEDYDEITSLLEEDATNGNRLEISCDPSLKRGCRAETPFGEVDGTIEGQLQEVIYDLQEVSRSD
ncbi:MAG TPA: hypothetical protein GX502_05800 [Syntrophaceticus sp.]|nr:hypothetical protein [Syntrophaceticus sp.]